MTAKSRPSQAMQEARNFDAWLVAAQDCDEQSGATAWREEDDSELLAADLMREHIADMARLQQQGDARGLAALLHESLYRHQGDITNPHLYDVAFAGTKQVIEEYLDAVVAGINAIADGDYPGLDVATKRELLGQAERNLGQSALLLSGGASMGFFHMGVVSAMLAQGLLPDVICGASMGALIGGGICSRNDTELQELFADLPTLYRTGLRFLPPRKAWRQRSLLDQQQLEHCARTNMGELTFAEAARHSGRQFCISVSPSRSRQKPRVLSPQTSPDVLLTSAIMASCAIPAMFPPVTLQARSAEGEGHAYLPGESWVDGTFQGDLPMKRLGRLFNVNHFIVSQVNPHALPFLVSRHGRGSLALATDLLLSSARTQAAQTLKVVQARVASPRWHNLLEHGRLVAEQEYKGDINIHPPLSGWMYRRMLSNPSLQDLQHYIRLGEQATWSQLAQIRNQTRVQQTLKACVARLG